MAVGFLRQHVVKRYVADLSQVANGVGRRIDPGDVIISWTHGAMRTTNPIGQRDNLACRIPMIIHEARHF
jgi:hypothetical protein